MFDKSPKRIQEATLERIKHFKANPYDTFLNNHQLIGKYQGCRSINITEDWRAVYTNKENDEILFVLLGTHSSLYG